MFIFHIHVFTLTYFNVFGKFCPHDLKLFIHFERPAFQRQRGGAEKPDPAESGDLLGMRGQLHADVGG